MEEQVERGNSGLIWVDGWTSDVFWANASPEVVVIGHDRKRLDEVGEGKGELLGLETAANEIFDMYIDSSAFCDDK